jgi:hypothetical protein
MKNIKLVSSLLLALSMFVASCSSDGNGNLPDLERVPIPLLKLDDKADVLIQEPAEFKGKFTVDMYFKNDVAPKQVDIVIAKNGDYKTIKVLQAAVTTFPITVDVDAAKLATLFGINVSQIVPGDFFEIGTNIVTQSGMNIPAFSDVSNQFSADVANFPGSSLSIKYPVVCALDLDEFVGVATAEDGFWEDTYDVIITKEGENTLVISGLIQDPKAIIKVVVDPKTVKTSVASTLVAPSLPPYTNLKVVASGELNQCTKTISLNTSFSVDQGNFSATTLVIKKK